MDAKRIDKIVGDYAAGLLGADELHRELHAVFVEEMGHAVVDHSRALRCGYPEVIFAEGKDPSHAVSIARSIVEKHGVVLATRVPDETARLLKEAFPQGEFHERSRTFAVGALSPREGEAPIVIVTAGTADLAVAEEALVTARFLGERAELIADVGVAGIHRLLNRIDAIRRAGVIIVVAGMEGALPSVIGGLVDRPVIAVPTSVGYGASFEGLAALLGMLNTCASGVTVVNIDNGFGAGYAAAVMNRRVPVGVQSIELAAGAEESSRLENELSDDNEDLPRVCLLETNIDNAAPDVIAHAVNRLLAEGALDVTQRPVVMKKNRLANALTVMTRPEDRDRLAALLAEEIPTAGIRTRSIARLELPREVLTAETPYGPIRAKRIGAHVHPEYEDCRRAAEAQGVPLRVVREAVFKALEDS